MKIHTYQVVLATYKKKEFYAEVTSVGKASINVKPLGDPSSEKIVRISRKNVRPVPSVTVTREELKAFARYEISYLALKKGNRYAQIVSKDNYSITVNDVLTAVINLQKKHDASFDPEDWYYGIDEELENCMLLDYEQYMEEDGLPNAASILSNAWTELSFIIEECRKSDLKKIQKEIETSLANLKRPFTKRVYTDWQKEEYLRFFDQSNRISAQPKKYRDLWKQFVEDLCAKGNEYAIYTKAYACYGNGNGVYKTDWKTSTECLLKLMKKAPDPGIANTLGYMYYYGRVNHGKPQYDKAFKYFSIGAAAGVHESIYKLSDMFLHGYGVSKDIDTAYYLIDQLYQECLEGFIDGEHLNEFADVALRMGGYYENKENWSRDANIAYYYYLQAQYALQLRRQAMEIYGDDSVSKHIKEAITKIKPMTTYKVPQKTVHCTSVSRLLDSQLRQGNLIEMTVHTGKGKEKELTFTALSKVNGQTVPFLVTVPEADYCQLKNEVTVSVKDITRWHIVEPKLAILFNEAVDGSFYLFGDEIADIDGDYVYKVKK
jgi:hypothetical protein